MLKLMKYEYRKTMSSKMILLVITAILEVCFLIGIFFDNMDVLAWGTGGLVICAMTGILYIGIESLVSFHRDLNTKQSYMLFLTPHSSYQILGAKVMENGISILVAGACFAGLAVLDFTIAILYMGGLKELIDTFTTLVGQLMHIRIDWQEFGRNLAVMFFGGLAAWIMSIVSGCLAILLSATALAGKKFSGFVSFVLYILLNWAYAAATNWALSFVTDDTLAFVVTIVMAMVFSTFMYLISGWIMERKLSV